MKDEVDDRVVEAERLAEVGVEDAVPIVGVLLGEWGVEAVGVAEGVDVGGGGSFAEHLDDGVAGDEVDEQEDDRDDDPEHGQRDEDAADGLPECGTGHAFASLLGSAGVADENLVTRLDLVRGRWLVESQLPEDVPCAS